MNPNLQPAVFLDRDGTIIEDRGHLRSPADVVFYPDTVRALQRLQEHFRLFIVTHQPGVSGGLVSAEEVARVNAHVVAELRRHGVVILEVYCCPHQREERCACIKPRPFFPEKAAREHGLDLARSFVVGDHPHDVALADNAGATGIYVLTGHGAKHRAELPRHQAITPGIREAVDWIFACGIMRSLEASQADMILDGGPCTIGVESTILSLASGRPVLLRLGGVPVEDIERITGPLTQAPSCNGCRAVAAPGMLPRHYSPRTPLKLIPEGEEWPPPGPGKKVGLLTFRDVGNPTRFASVEILSGSGDLREAAAALFGAMRRLDKRNLDLILARLVPHGGLGSAINDRLVRAAGQGT